MLIQIISSFYLVLGNHILLSKKQLVALSVCLMITSEDPTWVLLEILSIKKLHLVQLNIVKTWAGLCWKFVVLLQDVELLEHFCCSFPVLYSHIKGFCDFQTAEQSRSPHWHAPFLCSFTYIQFEVFKTEYSCKLWNINIFCLLEFPHFGLQFRTCVIYTFIIYLLHKLLFLCLVWS